MRKRFALLWMLVVLGAALALPATTAAVEGFRHKVVYNYCDGADPRLKVKNIAEGWTNANKLTNETWVERRPANGSWTRIYTWPLARYKFEIDGSRHWLTSWRTWNGDQTYWYRIGFRVRAWHNQNLLASAVIYSVKC